MPQLASVIGPIIAQAEDGTNLLSLVPWLVIIGGLFFVMIYLPRRRASKRAQDLASAIEIGDDIRTIGGIYGTIRSEDDDTYTLDLGGGNTMRVAKRAVAERVGDDDE